MKNVFTWGFGQKYPDSFVEIEGTDAGDCRRKMMEAFGRSWAFQYGSREAAGVERWGLKEITLETALALDGLFRAADPLIYLVPGQINGMNMLKTHIAGKEEHFRCGGSYAAQMYLRSPICNPRHLCRKCAKLAGVAQG